MSTFDKMELFPQLQRALEDKQYKKATAIQSQAIPPAIAGQDVLGCAQTGTGKTAAFAIPILDYIGVERPPIIANRPSALVLAPTRELAIQIGDSFRSYGRHMRFRQALVFGGVGQAAQVKALSCGVDLLIATPGRLMDLMDQRHIELGNVEMFVLDEADRMLDMGFLPALSKIIEALPRERQSLFFSATLPPKIRRLAAELLFNPVTVDVTPKSISVKRIKQTVRIVKRADKFNSLLQVLQQSKVDRGIIFTRTKHGANALTRKLDRAGILSAAIHGNKSQSARQKALESFRQKRLNILVATDVAARGIDISGVTHVINYDMPVDPESYVHRIGRTGRAGEEGIAVSFCTEEEGEELRAIEKLIGNRLNRENCEIECPSSSISKTQGPGRRRSRGAQARSRKSGVKRPNRRQAGSPQSRSKKTPRKHKEATAS